MDNLEEQIMAKLEQDQVGPDNPKHPPPEFSKSADRNPFTYRSLLLNQGCYN